MDRREAIVVAAREAFCEAGFSGTRTKDVAARAGVAESLVFKYFRSKEGLFEVAVLDALDRLGERVETAAAGFAALDRPLDQLEHARRFHGEMADLMVELGPLLGSVMFDQRALQTTHYGRTVAPIIERMANALSVSLDAIPSGIDPRFLALMFFGTHFFVALDARSGNGEPIAPETVADEFLSLLSHGLSRELDSAGERMPGRIRP